MATSSSNKPATAVAVGLAALVGGLLVFGSGSRKPAKPLGKPGGRCGACGR